MPVAVVTEIGRIKDPVERLLAFMAEREAIRKRRDGDRHAEEMGEAPQGPPWTQDPILARYRFTNVYREFDRVTQWIAQAWREPHKDDPDLWFAMVVARFVNHPRTMQVIGYPVPWRPDHFLGVMRERGQQGLPRYGNAYTISANQNVKGRERADYQVEAIFDPMWHNREVLRPKQGDTLNSYHMQLGMYEAVGSFMAAQVVADLKYVSPLIGAVDWFTFAASGPGSRRGLNRVLDRPPNSSWREDEWRLRLRDLQEQTREPLLERDIMVHAQDLQNCLCEFDKYERTRLGQGRPKGALRHG